MEKSKLLATSIDLEHIRIKYNLISPLNECSLGFQILRLYRPIKWIPFFHYVAKGMMDY
jgi:hypothetical protein